jgi:hypothetical protein
VIDTDDVVSDLLVVDDLPLAALTDPSPEMRAAIGWLLDAVHGGDGDDEEDDDPAISAFGNYL